jgi:hypothetical protein
MIFYYFLPNVTKEQVAQRGELDREVLAAAGLADVLADVRLVPRDASLCYCSEFKPRNAAGVLSGTIIAPVSKARGAVALPGFHLDRQTWRLRSLVLNPEPATLNCCAWIGTLIGELPTPPDLERRSIWPGGKARDAEGWEWHVPIARAAHWGKPYGVLSQSFTFDAAGEPAGHLDSEWQWLWDVAGQIRDWYVAASMEPGDREEESAAPPFGQLVKWAARILEVNYRLGSAELNLLHALGHPVLTNSVVHQICQAAYGWEILEEAKKK